MFAQKAGFTSVSFRFITGEGEAPNYLTPSGGARMAEASVPKINADGESPRSNGGRRRLDGVQVAETITSVEDHPGASILNRKNKRVKFGSYIIITGKITNRY